MSRKRLRELVFGILNVVILLEPSSLQDRSIEVRLPFESGVALGSDIKSGQNLSAGEQGIAVPCSDSTVAPIGYSITHSGLLGISEVAAR
ncbi:MAG TPA: hypothetical protein VJZ32_03200 [Candidatus Bathyarchaeia archaeon]|nr:hypothetical protein [Candidatus Bathyarchaeia archaeon]